MRLSTINLVVEIVLQSSTERHKKHLIERGISDDAILNRDAQEMAIQEANSVCIALKTACLCEMEGIDEAMRYYEGSHSSDEYVEYLTSVVAEDM